MTLRTRPPTGLVPPPTVLVEGETGSGRSWLTALLSADPRVGQMLWMELGRQTTADQYGAIPGVSYEIVEPDNDAGVWDFDTLLRATQDAWNEAARARDAGELPAALTVDHVGEIWDLLSVWAENRARSTKVNRDALAQNPNVEIKIFSNFWNDAAARWNQLMKLWLTYPGICILISDGSEVTLFENDRPTPGKTWKVAGQRAFTTQVPIWVRLFQDAPPRLIKLRTVVNGIQPGADRAVPLRDFSLAWLIFDRYGWDPTAGGVRRMVPMVAGSQPPESPRFKAFMAALDTTTELLDEATLKKTWHEHVPQALERGEITDEEARQVRLRIRSIVEAPPDEAPQLATAAAEAADSAPNGHPEPAGAAA